MAPSYYECHITLEPVVAASRAIKLAKICAKYEFRVSNLYMIKDDSRHTKDTFITARADLYTTLWNRMSDIRTELLDAGFLLRREKIEAVVYDYRYEQK
jgi:hypothetical protein